VRVWWEGGGLYGDAEIAGKRRLNCCAELSEVAWSQRLWDQRDGWVGGEDWSHDDGGGLREVCSVLVWPALFLSLCIYAYTGSSPR